MKARRRARAVALQGLYEIDFTQHSPEYALGCRLKERALPESATAFAFLPTDRIRGIGRFGFSPTGRRRR